MEKKLLILSLMFTTLMATSVYAQCGCDYTLKSATAGVLNTFKASDYPNYKPGDVFCMEGGAWLPSLFSGFVGTEADPIVFKNCNGQVDIDGIPVGMEFEFCENIKITGTGDDAFKYGIKVSGTQRNGVTFVRRTSGVEIEFVEISAGSSGLSAKTDPDCNEPTYGRGQFTFKNLKIHDLYVHHTGQEGFYVGNTSGFRTSKLTCSGVMEFAHLLENVEIYDNIIENTGRDGIQVSLAHKNMSVHDNYIYKYGRNISHDQNFGMSLGSGSKGVIYNNIIIQTDSFNSDRNGRGISLLSAKCPTTMYNNVIVNCGGPGIWMHQRLPVSDTLLTAGYYVINNTIINPGRGDVRPPVLTPRTGIFYDAVTSIPPYDRQEDLDQGFYNNIIINPGEEYPVNPNFWKGPAQEYIDFGFLEQLTNSNQSNNFTGDDVSALLFTDTMNNDFSITKQSPAKDFGMDVSAWGVTHDFNGNPYATDGTYDAGAFEWSPFPGINEINDDPGFTVYPNPAQEKIKISLELKRAGDVRVRIVNMNGAELFQGTFEDLKSGENELEVKMTDVSHKGVALMVVFTDDETRTKTILIE